MVGAYAPVDFWWLMVDRVGDCVVGDSLCVFYQQSYYQTTACNSMHLRFQHPSSNLSFLSKQSSFGQECMIKCLGMSRCDAATSHEMLHCRIINCLLTICYYATFVASVLPRSAHWFPYSYYFPYFPPSTVLILPTLSLSLTLTPPTLPLTHKRTKNKPYYEQWA